MPKIQTSCPRCRKPIMAEVEQLFDLNANPQAKQQLLSGGMNMAHCPSCGYEGMLSTPIVYHDPDKELLLTYFPVEMGLPVNEQEKMIGPLINQVVNKLPNEKRKAYLFRPQTMFTYQTMVEKILEADGITKEMLDAQQKRLNLLQRLLSTSPEARPEVIKQEESLIDQAFFGILNRLIEASMMQGDQQSAKAIAALQKELLENTEAGQKIKAQAMEMEAAVNSLKEASQKGLTREILLDLMITAPTEVRLTTLVSYTRSGMDYTFFQLLSDKIDTASSEEDKKKLVELREKLLQMTAEIDKAMQEQAAQTQKLLQEILASENIEAATEEALPGMNDLFVQLLQSEIQAARQKADLDRIMKLQKVMGVIEKASAPPKEVQFIEDLMKAEDAAALETMLRDNKDMISDEFISMLNNLVTQTAEDENAKEMNGQLQDVYRAVLRFKMANNLNA